MSDVLDRSSEGLPATLRCLVEAGVLDEPNARRAAQLARSSGQSPVAVINQLALADDARVLAILARQHQLKIVQPADIPSQPADLVNVAPAFLRKHRLLPLGWSADRLLVGVIDPDNSDGLAALSFAAGCAAEPLLMSASEQKRAFDALYGASADAQADILPSPNATAWVDDAVRMRDQADAGPAVRIVEALFEQAIAQNASDIHLEPLADRLRIRLRIDGVMRTIREEAAHLAAPVAARIKILADMDVADRRSAQDGRTSLAAQGRPVDVRVSTVPSAFGETVAIRLLRRDASLLNLPGLGFSAPMLAIFEHIISLRRGLFLITGPTGSGKTTTLYAMIERMRSDAIKILSVEDPIEYYFGDITQVQVNEDAGLTFATALRSFLRQDPDVILVGEVRDSETAKIAVQAALTGHLVLATLHTVDAPGSIARLADMGVDRYLVAATLAGVVSQRLVRRLCPHCRRTRPLHAYEQTSPADASQTSEALGCSQCRQSGFAGRLAIAEGFLVDDALRETIIEPSGAELTRALKQSGFQNLAQSASNLAAKGELSIAEMRALGLS